MNIMAAHASFRCRFLSPLFQVLLRTAFLEGSGGKRRCPGFSGRLKKGSLPRCPTGEGEAMKKSGYTEKQIAYAGAAEPVSASKRTASPLTFVESRSERCQLGRSALALPPKSG